MYMGLFGVRKACSICLKYIEYKADEKNTGGNQNLSVIGVSGVKDNKKSADVTVDNCECVFSNSNTRKLPRFYNYKCAYFIDVVMNGKQFDLFQSLSTHYLKLTRVTMAVSLILIASIVLCSKKKKAHRRKAKNKSNIVVAAFVDQKNGKESWSRRYHYVTRYHIKQDSNSMRCVPQLQHQNANNLDEHGERMPESNKKSLYPRVKEPTISAKLKREEALEEDRVKKTKEGFYQSHSDEDDTLEPIKSLKDEETDPEDKSKSVTVTKSEDAKTTSKRSNKEKKLLNNSASRKNKTSCRENFKNHQNNSKV
ncbi:unnamed protein product [Thelazia callipaeda]|uniref:Uncharacterized protein n=1 Tax=Thelazia callipaeda TaxID=103827 RepID=A0A0N5CPN3_THECL|nr:unnamed protein product [Thelazia callipaeda]